jgi:hypothetical protein
LAATLGLAVLALVPTSLFATSASANHVVDQGCVHYREFKGPYQAWSVNGYLRCNNRVVWREPAILRGPDNGGCKKMVPDHLVVWQGGPHGAAPWEHFVQELKPCGSG